MAGKNQHHIWQMVQRGFGIKRGRDHHIWVYSKEAKPKQTVTRKHGAEEYFFSLDGDSTADEVLTSFENSIQSHLQMVRTYPDGTAVESEFMAPVISHLEIRSLFIRDEFSKLGKRAVEKIGDIFGSKRKASALMLNYLFHPGRSHRPSPLCIFHGTFGPEGHSGALSFEQLLAGISQQP